mgnify:CR=1 FL=1
MTKVQRLNFLAWSLCVLTMWLALYAWLTLYDWIIWPLSLVQVFPLLGLWAFSVMWVHYVVGFLRDQLELGKDSLKRFYEITGYGVLVLLCLHPGLLIIYLYQQGHGLPPLSYERFVAPGLGWITLLGTASLLVFLAFELRRWFDKKGWWHWVVDAGDFAMLAIVYHALRLGTNLGRGWYKTIWIFYAIVLAFIIGRKYFTRLSQRQSKTTAK